MALNEKNSLEKRILNIAHIQNGNTILDVGCGTGELVILTKLKFPMTMVIGLDPDVESLTIAKEDAQEENVEVRFIQGIAENIPYKVSTFDVVVSSLTFHHLPRTSKKQAIREIYRVLKPTGTFYLVDIGKPKNLFWKSYILLAALLEPDAYFEDNIEGNIPDYLREAGFSISEARQPYLGIYFWEAKKV